MLARRFTIVVLLITLFGMGLSILVARTASPDNRFGIATATHLHPLQSGSMNNNSRGLNTFFVPMANR